MGDYDKNQADDQGGKGDFDKQQSQEGTDKKQFDDGQGKGDDQDYGDKKPQG